MATPRTRPLSRRLQARLFRMINVPMRVLLGLPVATPLGKRLMLISFTGRKTGKAYRQPVSYVPDNGALLTPGGGNWKLNLRDGEPVRIRLRGRDVVARPEIVADPGEVERLLSVMAATSPSVMRFVRIPKGPDGRFDPARLDAALRYGFRIVRWHLDDAAARG
jgi:deazaflavin-dependent oxidoreductase (nitroreductase family)